MFKVIQGRMGRHRLFLRLLAPNVLFLLFPLLVGWFVYNKTLDVVEHEVTAGNMNLLKQTRDTLDHRFAEIGSIARQFVNDTRIQQFQHVTEPFAGPNLYRVLETRKSLYNYSLTNNFIFNYFIIFKNSKLVLTENGTYDLAEFMNNFHYDGMERQLSERLFLEDYHDRLVLPAQDVSWNGTNYSLLTYVQSLGYPGYAQGAVVVTVDNRDIRKLLSGLDLSGGGQAYILKEDGTMLSSASSDEAVALNDNVRLSGSQGSIIRDIGSRKMMMTYANSNYNGWTYLVVQPADVVLEKVHYIKKITFTMALLFLLLGVLIAYMIAYRNSRPLRRIIETITERTAGEDGAGKDAYRFIGDTISGLIDNNRKLRDEMEKQLPFLQAAVFERLLKGEYLSLKEMPVLLQHVGSATQGNFFVSAILKIVGYGGSLNRGELTQLRARRVMAKDLLRQAWGESVYLHDIAEDQIVILLPFENDDEEMNMRNLEQAIRSSYETITERLNVSVRLAAGGIHEGLINVARSYEEAKRTLDYQNWIGTNGVMSVNKLPTENGYYYPADLELRLTNLTKAGDREAVDALLMELYRINFEERGLSLAMLQLFMNEIWGTVVKLLPQVSMDNEIALKRIYSASAEAGTFEGLKNNFTAVVNTFRHICDNVNEHKKSQNVILQEKIVSMLHDNYTQTELCLEAVADRFNISKGYLSQFFKEQTGVNFSEYLENLRMNQAREWLVQTDMSVNEIAVRVGYSSSNTFCRAFKRIYGISTTEFRRSHAS